MKNGITNWYSDSQKKEFLESQGYYVERVNGIKVDFMDVEYEGYSNIAFKFNESPPDDIDYSPYLDNTWYKDHDMDKVFKREFLNKLIKLLSK